MEENSEITKIKEDKNGNLKITNQKDQMLEAIDRRTEADETNHTIGAEKNSTKKENQIDTQHQGHHREDTITMTKETDRTLGTETNMKETMIDRVEKKETKVQTSTGMKQIGAFWKK